MLNAKMMCAECGRPTVKVDRKKCKTCGSTTFKPAQRLQDLSKDQKFRGGGGDSSVDDPSTTLDAPSAVEAAVANSSFAEATAFASTGVRPGQATNSAQQVPPASKPQPTSALTESSDAAPGPDSAAATHQATIASDEHSGGASGADHTASGEASASSTGPQPSTEPVVNTDDRAATSVTQSASAGNTNKNNFVGGSASTANGVVGGVVDYRGPRQSAERGDTTGTVDADAPPAAAGSSALHPADDTTQGREPEQQQLRVGAAAKADASGRRQYVGEGGAHEEAAAGMETETGNMSGDGPEEADAACQPHTTTPTTSPLLRPTTPVAHGGGGGGGGAEPISPLPSQRRVETNTIGTQTPTEDSSEFVGVLIPRSTRAASDNDHTDVVDMTGVADGVGGLRGDGGGGGDAANSVGNRSRLSSMRKTDVKCASCIVS